MPEVTNAKGEVVAFRKMGTRKALVAAGVWMVLAPRADSGVRGEQEGVCILRWIRWRWRWRRLIRRRVSPPDVCGRADAGRAQLSQSSATGWKTTFEK